MESGSTLTNRNSTVGYGINATGDLTVTGEGSQWINTGSLNVGYFGKGTVNILDGGKASSNAGYIGAFQQGQGDMVVSGEASLWQNTTQIVVGYDGQGTLLVEEGGKVTTQNFQLGRAVTSGSTNNGTATVTGEGSLLEISSNLLIGHGTQLTTAGKGTLNILDGGTVRVLGETTLALDQDVLYIDGGTLHTHSLNAANGTVNLRDGTLHIDGGTYTHKSEADLVVTGNTAQANPLFHFSNGATTTGIRDLYVGSSNGNGQVLVESGSTLTTRNSYVGESAGHTGTVTVTGEDALWHNTGSLIVGSSDGPSYQDYLNVSDGGRVISEGGLTIQQSGALAGNGGKIIGNVTNYGIITPGNSPGTLTIDGDLTLMNTSVLFLEVTGSTPGVDSDQIFVNGDLFIGGMMYFYFNGLTQPTYDTAYDLIHVAGDIVGDWTSFSNIFSFYNMSYINSNMRTLTIEDSNVSGYDKVLRMTLMGTDGPAPDPVPNTDAVPEPASAMLVGLGGLALLARRRRM